MELANGEQRAAQRSPSPTDQDPAEDGESEELRKEVRRSQIKLNESKSRLNQLNFFMQWKTLSSEEKSEFRLLFD